MKYLILTLLALALTACATNKPQVKDPSNPTEAEIKALIEHKYGDK